MKPCSVEPRDRALHLLKRPLQCDLHPSEVLINVGFEDVHTEVEVSAKTPNPRFLGLFLLSGDIDDDTLQSNLLGESHGILPRAFLSRHGDRLKHPEGDLVCGDALDFCLRAKEQAVTQHG